jgi:hypothetical protein
MIFDWMFSAWMLSTIALMLLTFSLLLSVRRRLLKIETKLDQQDEKIFQLALAGRLPIPIEVQRRSRSDPRDPQDPPEIEQKKGGWPKGKKRKPKEIEKSE